MNVITAPVNLLRWIAMMPTFAPMIHAREGSASILRLIAMMAMSALMIYARGEHVKIFQ